MIVSINRLTGLRKAYAAVPALLVIALGLFIIAAAAFASRQGVDTAVPIAVLGVLFVFAFLGTQRAAVVFVLEGETVQSAMGSYTDASAVIRAVERMRQSAVERN